MTEQLLAARCDDAPDVTDTEALYRPIFQRILPSALHSDLNRAKARTAVLNWAVHSRNLLHGDIEALPATAFAGAAFAIENEDVIMRAAWDEEQRLWYFQAEHRDARMPDRRWRVEVFVSSRYQRDLIGVRLSGLAPAHERIYSRVPGFYRDLIACNELMDGAHRVSATPILLTSEAAYKDLLELLFSENRALPVVLVSPFRESGVKRRYAVDPVELARVLQGHAHVAVLADEYRVHVRQDIGTHLLPWNGSVRVCEPGFAREDDPREHRLYHADYIVGMPRQNPFSHLLESRLVRGTVNAPARLSMWPEPPSRTLVETPHIEDEASSLLAGVRRWVGGRRRS